MITGFEPQSNGIGEDPSNQRVDVDSLSEETILQIGYDYFKARRHINYLQSISDAIGCKEQDNLSVYHNAFQNPSEKSDRRYLHLESQWKQIEEHMTEKSPALFAMIPEFIQSQIESEIEEDYERYVARVDEAAGWGTIEGNLITIDNFQEIAKATLDRIAKMQRMAGESYADFEARIAEKDKMVKEQLSRIHEAILHYGLWPRDYKQNWQNEDRIHPDNFDAPIDLDF